MSFINSNSKIGNCIIEIKSGMMQEISSNKRSKNYSLHYFKEEEDQINRSHSLKVARVLKIKSPYLTVHRVSVNSYSNETRFFKNHFHRARLTPTAFPRFPVFLLVSNIQ